MKNNVLLSIDTKTSAINRYVRMLNKELVKTHSCVYGGLLDECNRKAELELFRTNPPNDLMVFTKNASNSDNILA